MKKIAVLLILSLISCDLIANDGVFYASGNTLIPLAETNIELKKEILIINKGNSNNKLERDPINVNIYFEFYNPDNEVERLIGFVTPPAGGVLNDSEAGHPQIRDFKVSVNNRLIDFKVARVDSTEFIPIIGSSYGQDFIYYFKAKFQKGINAIRHSYSYKGSEHADYARPGPDYEYRLTTGKSWANKKIDDFELYVNIGNETYFSVPYSFQKDNEVGWQIVGIGKLGSVNPDRPMERFVKISSGYLYYKTTDFKPDFDLTITTINPLSEIKEYSDFFYSRRYDKPRKISEFSDYDLRIMRNSIYAIYGYQFRSKELLDYFSKYNWYLPDPNIKFD